MNFLLFLLLLTIISTFPLASNASGQKNDRQLRKAVNCEMLKDGNYVWDCSSYYSICANGRELPMECYSGLKLNPNTNQCDTPSSVDQCHKKRGTSNKLYRAVDPFSCQDYPDGDYESGACSSKFYSCVKGQKLDKNCPPGLVYKSNTRACDFAAKCHKKPHVQKAIAESNDEPPKTRTEDDEDQSAISDRKAPKATATDHKAKKSQSKVEDVVEDEFRSDEQTEETTKSVPAAKPKPPKNNQLKLKRIHSSDPKVSVPQVDQETTTKGGPKNDADKIKEKLLPKTATKSKNLIDRKRREIRTVESYMLPPPQQLRLAPPAVVAARIPSAHHGQQVAPALSSSKDQSIVAHARRSSNHYTVFNLYFPNNPKFNVVRSDRELDGDDSVSAESADTANTDQRHSSLVEQQTKTKPNVIIEQQQQQQKNNRAASDEFAKDLLEAEEIGERLFDLIRDM